MAAYQSTAFVGGVLACCQGRLPQYDILVPQVLHVQGLCHKNHLSEVWPDTVDACRVSCLF